MCAHFPAEKMPLTGSCGEPHESAPIESRITPVVFGGGRHSVERTHRRTSHVWPTSGFLNVECGFSSTSVNPACS